MADPGRRAVAHADGAGGGPGVPPAARGARAVAPHRAERAAHGRLRQPGELYHCILASFAIPCNRLDNRV